MSSSIFCQLCGQPIVGKGRSFHHPDWPSGVSLRTCTNCARHLPRCRNCGLPMAQADPSHLCETCRLVMPVCLACNRTITGKPSFYDGIGPYCPECKVERSSCDICSAPMTDESWRLSDGRKICSFCQSSSIFSAEAAMPLFGKIKDILTGELGLSLNIPTALALVDRNQLQEVIHHQMQENNGHRLEPGRTLGIYARSGMRRGIYIQNGLPRALFLQVAAHEYAHAWQGENCPVLRDEVIREGFAEWVAYRVIGALGLYESQKKMLDRQDIYGEALRWALEFQARQGVRTLIDACRENVLN